VIRLTERQRQVLDFVRQGFADGHPPSMREICRHLGVRSTNGITDHLRALEAKGYLRHQPGMARLAWVPVAVVPPISVAWLLGQAVRLHDAIDDHHGRSVLAVGGPWWRLVVSTGGWSSNEEAVRSADPIWHGLTHQATIRGGLHVWASGGVPDDLGGDLGPVSLGAW
jgi:hypothetical protein